MGFTYSNSSGASNTLVVPGGWTVLEDDGIVEANPEQGPMATVRFKVLDAADRYSFVNQLLGQWTGTPPNSIVYAGPYAYPPSPNLVCTAVPDIRGFDKPKPLSIGLPWLFKKSAIVTAVFTRPPWQAATSGGYFSIGFSGAGEVFTLPETTYQFGDGTPTSTPVGIPMVQSQITVTRYRMPFIPDAYSAQLLNTVNSTPFSIGWNTYAAGYLLFAGINSEVEADPLGNITYQVQYVFLYRSVPWNYSFHPNRTTGFALVTDGNGNPPLQSGNFNLLP